MLEVMYAAVVLATLRGLPKPVSASAITGTMRFGSEEARLAIIRALSCISLTLISARSGMPRTLAVVPAPVCEDVSLLLSFGRPGVFGGRSHNEQDLSHWMYEAATG